MSLHYALYVVASFNCGGINVAVCIWCVYLLLWHLFSIFLKIDPRPAAAGLQSYSGWGRAACGGLWVLGGGGCAGWGGGCGWSTQEWEFENILHLGDRQGGCVQTPQQLQGGWLFQESSSLEADYFWCRKGRKYSTCFYFVNLHVPSIMSKWIAAAQPAAPSAYTLGLLFHVDNKLGDCDLCLVYFNSLNLKKKRICHLKQFSQASFKHQSCSD